MSISPGSSISSNKGGSSKSEKYLKLEDFNSFSNKIDNTLSDITKVLNQLVVDKKDIDSKSNESLKSELTFSKHQIKSNDSLKSDKTIINVPIRNLKEVENEMKLKNLLFKNKNNEKSLTNIFIRKMIVRDGDCGAHCLRSIIKEVRGVKVPLDEIKDYIFKAVVDDQRLFQIVKYGRPSINTIEDYQLFLYNKLGLESYVSDSEIEIICQILNLNVIILHDRLDISPPKTFICDEQDDAQISFILCEKDHYDIGFLAAESYYVEKDLIKGYHINKEGEYRKKYTVATWRKHNKVQEVDEDFEIYEIYNEKKGDHHEFLNPRRNSLDQNYIHGIKRNNRRSSSRYDPSVTQNTLPPPFSSPLYSSSATPKKPEQVPGNDMMSLITELVKANSKATVIRKEFDYKEHNLGLRSYPLNVVTVSDWWRKVTDFKSNPKNSVYDFNIAALLEVNTKIEIYSRMTAKRSIYEWPHSSPAPTDYTGLNILNDDEILEVIFLAASPGTKSEIIALYKQIPIFKDDNEKSRFAGKEINVYSYQQFMILIQSMATKYSDIDDNLHKFIPADKVDIIPEAWDSSSSAPNGMKMQGVINIYLETVAKITPFFSNLINQLSPDLKKKYIKGNQFLGDVSPLKVFFRFIFARAIEVSIHFKNTQDFLLWGRLEEKIKPNITILQHDIDDKDFEEEYQMCLTRDLYKPTSDIKITSKELPCLKMDSCKDGRSCKFNHVNPKLYSDLASRLKAYGESISKREANSLHILDTQEEPNYNLSIQKIKGLSPAHVETHLYGDVKDDEGRPPSTGN